MPSDRNDRSGLTSGRDEGVEMSVMNKDMASPDDGDEPVRSAEFWRTDPDGAKG
jgi:hypothetical protein